MKRLLNPAAALLRALRRSAGDAVDLTHGGETPWASITFVGAQHRVRVSGASDGWLDALDEADLPMPAHFVASVDVVRDDAGATLTVLVLEA